MIYLVTTANKEHAYRSSSHQLYPEKQSK
jgi:hypothetical protein